MLKQATVRHAQKRSGQKPLWWHGRAALTLLLSACGQNSVSISPDTAQQVSHRLYVTTYQRPPTMSATAPVISVNALASDTGTPAWHFTTPLIIGFHNALPTSDGARIYTVSDTLPTNPSDTSLLSGSLLAVRASDGKTIWKKQLGAFIASPVVADGVVYTSATQVSGQGSQGTQRKQTKEYYALRASDGQQLWRTQVAGDDGANASFALVNGVLYVSSNEICFDSCSYAFLLALRASDGKLLWKNTFSGNFTIPAPVVDAGVVYLNLPDMAPQDVAYGGQSDIVAFDAASGAQLWRRSIYLSRSGAPAPIIALHGVVYTGLAVPLASDPFRPDHWSYSLVALDGHSGAERWHVPTALYPVIVATDSQALYVQTSAATASGSLAQQYLSAYSVSGAERWRVTTTATIFTASNGELLGMVSGDSPTVPAQVVALNAQTGATLWQSHVTAQVTNNNMGETAGAYVLTSDTLYIALTSRTLFAFNLSDGQAQWRQTLASQIIALQAV